MRIAVISSTVFACPPAGYAGLEMVAWQCCRGLAKLGHHVTLFAPDGSRGDGFDVAHFGPAGQVGEKEAYDRYWKHLNHFHAVVDHSWAKFSYCLKQEGALKAPVLGVFHAPIDTMMKSLPQGVDRPCPVLISDDQRVHFEGLFNRPGRTCHNGIDLEYYRPVEGAVRNGRALFLARFSAIKGADLAVEACLTAGVGLDLIGDARITNEPEYLAAVIARCDGEKIRMVGPETRGGTVLRYSQASFMLHPNMRFREPFGLAPVEAMACGLPVVCWDNGAMRETVVNGETGYLINSYDQLLVAMKLCADDGAIDDNVRNKCRERASLFSVDRMARRYSDLCQEAVQGGW